MYCILQVPVLLLRRKLYLIPAEMVMSEPAPEDSVILKNGCGGLDLLLVSTKVERFMYYIKIFSSICEYYLHVCNCDNVFLHC